MLENHHLYGLREHLIHPWEYAFFDISLLGVTRDGWDDGLPHTMTVKIFPYLLSGLVAIHEGHVAVHKDEVVVAELEAIILNIVYDKLESFLAIERFVADLVRVYSHGILKYNKKGINIKTLVVYDKNPSALHRWLYNFLHHNRFQSWVSWWIKLAWI